MNEKNLNVFIDLGTSNIRLGIFNRETSNNLFVLEKSCFSNLSLKNFDINNCNKTIKDLVRSAEKKIDEDWGSSDWHVAMEEMWDSLLKRHNGKVTPETMEQAAEEVIMMHGEQMGYDEDSHDDGVSQVISMFLNRQDGIKNSDMVGLANDTWKHSEKTKYM